MPDEKKREPAWIPVPAGARSQLCQSPRCRKVIYKVPHPRTGNTVPVDCEVEGGYAPSLGQPGRGVSHFGTCVDWKTFSRKAK